MRLQGKTAIVTGGASGFGAGIVRKFIAEGARVMIADIDGRAARAFAASLGPFAVGYPADVSVDEGVRAMTDEAQAAFGHIDILVNNAGVTHLPADMEKVGDADFARIADVNMKAIFLTARHIVPLMKARKKGAILNMASTAAVSPRPRIGCERSRMCSVSFLA